jgi:DNA-binding NarL/FixJ family response regulator
VEAPIRILLVEDNEVYRSSLELLLGLEPGLEVVGSLGDGSSAAAAAVDLRADVVLMDFRLPGLDGAAATAAVRDARPDAAVVCLTAEASPAERDAVRAAGAVAFVDKGDPLADLVAALREAAREKGLT